MRTPHKTKRKRVKRYFNYNIEARMEEVERHLPKKHPVEYGPCDLCGSSEGKLHTGEPCQFICDQCNALVKKWEDKKRQWKLIMTKGTANEVK